MNDIDNSTKIELLCELAHNRVPKSCIKSNKDVSISHISKKFIITSHTGHRPSFRTAKKCVLFGDHIHSLTGLSLQP